MGISTKRGIYELGGNGHDTVATLTVNAATPPTITTQTEQIRTVTAGQHHLQRAGKRLGAVELSVQKNTGTGS